MASVKVKFRPSTVNGKEGTLYYQVIHNRVVRQINTEYKLFVSEWDSHSETVVLHHLLTGQERNNYLLSIGSRIKWDKDRLNKIIHKLFQSGTFVTDDVVMRFHENRQELSFNAYISQQIARLKRLGKIRTSETYTAALRSFNGFINGKDVLFDQLNADLLAEYEAYLKGRGNTPNSISFYMRILKAVYNRAVEDGLTEQRHPFKSVYTGVEKTMKRALSLNDIRRIKGLDLSLKPNLDYARDMFLFCFYTRGMSFIDMAYLRKKDLQNGTLSYRRRKTGRPLSVTLTPEAMILVKKYMNRDPSSPYLFPLLKSREGTKEAYREYQLALRSFNQQLMLLGELLGLSDKLSSYTARHTWATTAYYCEIHPGIISEAMGHSSITVTETYLKPFRSKKIDEANKQVLDFVKRSVVGVSA